MDDARLRAALAQFVAADVHDFRHASVRRAEFERALFGVGENLAAILDDLLGGRFAILHLDAEMMNAGASAGKLRLRLVLAVISHQREVDCAFGHVTRGVATRMAGFQLIDAKDIFIELGGLLQILNLERDVNDAGHVLISSWTAMRTKSDP